MPKLTVDFPSTVQLVEHVNPMSGGVWLVFNSGEGGHGWLYIGNPTDGGVSDYKWETEVITPPPPPPPPNPYKTYKVVNRNGLNIRSSPSLSGQVIGGLDYGQLITVNDEGQTQVGDYLWGKLTGEGEKWIAMKYKTTPYVVVTETVGFRIEG